MYNLKRKKMTFKEFEKETLDATDAMPARWRLGQKVFNYIDLAYPGLARYLQTRCGVDCFYNDKIIPEFLQKAYDTILELNPNDLNRDEKI